MTAAEVLRNAAKVIRKRGWIQGRYVGDKGEMCASRAIMVSAKNEPDGTIDREAQTAAARLMFEHLMIRYNVGIIGWNDYVAKSAAEVCAKLEEVAEELEG